MDRWSMLYKTLTTPVKVGNFNLSLMVVLGAILILLGTVIFSRLLIRFLKKNVFSRARIRVGLQETISRVLHYIIMTLGVLVSIDYLGVDLTALAAVGAVLMVGIGFGLQNLANNFISGLVLLFERPIQVGDFVEVNGVLGTVQAINARSTTVETQDNVAILVPNSHFVSENVTNWSYRNTRTRIHVLVHVALDSDVDLVEKTLLKVAQAHTEVLSDPAPRVQFLAFEEFALRFDLLPWILDPTRQFFIRSDLNSAIARAFQENGIRIPFPQRDLHLRSTVPVSHLSEGSEKTNERSVVDESKESN